MNIIIENSLTRIYGDRKVVYFTLIDDAENSYKMLDDIPATANAQEYLDARIEEELAFALAEVPWRNRYDASEVAKAKAILDNLPSWQTVSDAIDAATTLAACKVIIKKLARVVYWLARKRAD